MSSNFIFLIRVLNVFSLWLDSLIFPAYFGGLSILAILLHLFFTSKPVTSVFSLLFGIKTVDPINDAPENASPAATGGLLACIHQHITSLGGVYVFMLRVARFVSCLVLLALAVASLVLEQRSNLPSDLEEEYKHYFPLTDDEWLQVAICMTYVINCPGSSFVD
jgi:hypothetical protein